MQKIYSALFDSYYPLNKFFPNAQKVCLNKQTNSFSGPGLLVLWGGSDIHPSLYGRPNYGSNVGVSPSERDALEASLVEKAIDQQIPILGVCRGAQLVCAAAGGTLIQHVNNHTRDHQIETIDGRKMVTSSVHHQMMFPWDVEHKLLAWSAPPRSNVYIGIDEAEAARIPEKEGQYVEPEIVLFPDIKGLAVQGHPEYMDFKCLFNEYLRELLDTHLL